MAQLARIRAVIEWRWDLNKDLWGSNEESREEDRNDKERSKERPRESQEEVEEGTISSVSC